MEQKQNQPLFSPPFPILTSLAAGAMSAILGAVFVIISIKSDCPLVSPAQVIKSLPLLGFGLIAAWTSASAKCLVNNELREDGIALLLSHILVWSFGFIMTMMALWPSSWPPAVIICMQQRDENAFSIVAGPYLLGSSVGWWAANALFIAKRWPKW